jgi:hypothetical protein
MSRRGLVTRAPPTTTSPPDDGHELAIADIKVDASQRLYGAATTAERS